MKKLLPFVMLLALPSIASPREAYVLCTGATEKIFTTMAIKPMVRLKKRYGCEFLWAERDGRGWLIRDEEFLEKADALFAPLNALKPEQHAVEQEERELDREEERLDDREDRASRERLREIHAKQHDVAARERALDEREEELERVAERQLWSMIDTAIRKGVAKREDV